MVGTVDFPSVRTIADPLKIIVISPDKGIDRCADTCYYLDIGRVDADGRPEESDGRRKKMNEMKEGAKKIVDGDMSEGALRQFAFGLLAQNEMLIAAGFGTVESIAATHRLSIALNGGR